MTFFIQYKTIAIATLNKEYSAAEITQNRKEKKYFTIFLFPIPFDCEVVQPQAASTASDRKSSSNSSKLGESISCTTADFNHYTLRA